MNLIKSMERGMQMFERRNGREMIKLFYTIKYARNNFKIKDSTFHF